MPDFEKFHIFCDESATQSRFTVIGLIVCSETVAPKFELWIEDIVARHGGTSELKWTKAKKHNIQLYKDVCDAFFKAKAHQHAQFFSIVVDNSKMNHSLYNEGDKELGFNKMVFQLLYSMVRKFRNRPRFYAYLDERTTKHTPEKIRKMLNAKASKDLHIHHNPYRVCQFRKSHESRLIQITDILCGAIAYKTNLQDKLVGAAAQKIDLAEHIQRAANVLTLAKGTPRTSIGFDIWHIDFSATARKKAGVQRA